MSSTIDKQKQRGLRDAALACRINDVRKYLQDGAVNVNGKGCWGWTALHYACCRGHRNIAGLLLDHGADIDARSYDDNETPLIIACGNGHAATAKLLLDRGADIDAATSDKCATPLMMACLNGHTATTKLLLDRGCAINAVANNENTALHLACKNGHLQCVKELLAHGADTNIENNDGHTPLDVAEETKNQAVIDIFMKHKKIPHQAPMNSIDDADESEVMGSTLKAEASSEQAQPLEKLISQQAPIFSIEDVKNDVESEVMSTLKAEASSEQTQPLEKLISQLTISNTEVITCVSNLSTNLSSKISSIERELDSMKIGMTKIHEEQNAMAREHHTMARNLEQMNQSLQRITGDHSIVSKVNGISADGGSGGGGGGGVGIDSERKKGVVDFEKDKDSSLTVLKTIEEELHQSLSYCQSMLS
jgi:ankyrin repeat protein